MIVLHFTTGPPGNDGVGLPGRQGDRGEPGRPGKSIISKNLQDFFQIIYGIYMVSIFTFYMLIPC